MAGPVRTAKSRKRPQSRASTSSVHSATTQPSLDQSFADATAEVYHAQWLKDNRSQQRELAPPLQQHMTPEDMILQAASQAQSSRDFALSSSTNNPLDPSASFSQATARRQSLSGDNFSVNNSFLDPDSQLMDRDMNDDGDSVVGAPGVSKASRSSANNELEMRQLFQSSRHRKLQEVAAELHGNERGPNSERTRQVFAMLWYAFPDRPVRAGRCSPLTVTIRINQVCATGKGSVPRGRVYANYASRCATERITVLNPASFGKLVRVLFPGLKTRRLGVRGESKYHYVNFTLAEEGPEQRDSSIPQVPLLESGSFSQNFRYGKAAPPAPAATDREQQPVQLG